MNGGTTRVDLGEGGDVECSVLSFCFMLKVSTWIYNIPENLHWEKWRQYKLFSMPFGGKEERNGPPTAK